MNRGSESLRDGSISHFALIHSTRKGMQFERLRVAGCNNKSRWLRARRHSFLELPLRRLGVRFCAAGNSHVLEFSSLQFIKKQ